MNKKKNKNLGSHWNYRILAHEYVLPGQKRKKVYFQIHEVYYNEDGKPNGYTKDPIAIGGDTLPELIKEAAMILEAATRSTRTHLRDNGYSNKVFYAGDKFPKEYKPL